MLIDWFTVGAQAVNFGVLVWLLKRFLYKPITAAIDAREKRIAAELADADAKKTAAGKAQAEFIEQSRQFAAERATLLAKAVTDAGLETRRLAEEARQVAADLSTVQRDERERDKVALAAELSNLAVQEVYETTRRVLKDLASADLEERFTGLFIRHLQELSGTAKDELSAALQTRSDAPVVRTRFAPTAAMKNALQNAVNVTFSADIPLCFDVALDGLCGIELRVNGRRLAWSMTDYLGALETRTRALLSAQVAAS